jgi:hypothetical protein
LISFSPFFCAAWKFVETQRKQETVMDCGEQEYDGDDHQAENVEFEQFPKTLETKTETAAVRVSFIPGLLTLSEVDLILRGKFKPPFEQSPHNTAGGCFSNLTSEGTKKVHIFIPV